MHLAMRPTPCTIGQVYLLVFYKGGQVTKLLYVIRVNGFSIMFINSLDLLDS